MNMPLLTPEGERELVLRWQQHKDVAAQQQIIVMHQPLVKKYVRAYLRTGIPMEDLLQEGVLGLFDALDRFDPEKETRFSTYARWWVRYYMQRYSITHRRCVRIATTRGARKVRERIGRVERQFLQAEGRAPTNQELADLLEVALDDVERVRTWLSVPDTPTDPHDYERHEGNVLAGATTTVVDHGALPEDAVHRRTLTERFKEVFARASTRLSERQRRVLELRLLEDVPLRTIGEELGVTGERIRQIETAALHKLRSTLEVMDPKLVRDLRMEMVG